MMRQRRTRRRVRDGGAQVSAALDEFAPETAAPPTPEPAAVDDPLVDFPAEDATTPVPVVRCAGPGPEAFAGLVPETPVSARARERRPDRAARSLAAAVAIAALATLVLRGSLVESPLAIAERPLLASSSLAGRGFEELSILRAATANVAAATELADADVVDRRAALDPPRPQPRGPALKAIAVAEASMAPVPALRPAMPEVTPPAAERAARDAGPGVLIVTTPPAVPGPPATQAAALSPPASDAIDGVLSRYRAAYNRLDSGAARAVWPSVDARALARAFERLESQTIEFDHCAIAVDGGIASATCAGSARYVPRVGRRTAQAESREWRFSLKREGSDWVIDAVDAR